MQIWFLIWNDSLKKETVTHSIILAWEIPWKEEAGGLQSMQSQRSQIHFGDWTRVKLMVICFHVHGFLEYVGHKVFWFVCKHTRDANFIIKIVKSSFIKQVMKSNSTLISLTEFTFSRSKGFFIFVTVVQSLLCLTLCDSMDCSMPSFPVLNCLLKFAQIHVHWVSEAIWSFYPLPLPLILPLIFPSVMVFSNE